ncbi:MAG: D-alanyl-D-alanine-carboxypeptidase/endopeptidase AmpH [Pseudomonadota bacterium]
MTALSRPVLSCLHSSVLGLALGAIAVCGLSATAIADPLLDETVEFTGSVLFLQSKVPGLVIGAVKNGETAIRGFGERLDGGEEPDGDTVLRIGSITKAFTGQVLASLAAEGKVSLTQTLSSLAPDVGTGKDPNVAKIRLIDIATHSAGLPREVPHEPGPVGDPFSTITRDTFSSWLGANALLYPPGTGILYSNFAFDLLAIGLSEATKTPYPQVLKKRVTDPLGLRDTVFELSDDQRSRLMEGHGFDGTALRDVPTGDVIVGSGGLYSTPKDLLRWMQWHLDRFDEKDAEVRMLDHAVYLVRDNLRPVSGMDESGHMDAMSLGWVVMMPEGNRPLILQKAGGLQGTFSYIAFAPTRGVAAFVAINEFDFNAAMSMAEVINEMITSLAPR